MLSITLATLAFLTLSAAAAGATHSESENNVIIISIDGFYHEYLWDENIPLPTIRELAEEGAYAEAMIPANPSNTWPNHTSIVTGTYPDRHGLVHNGKLIRGEPGEPLYVDNERDKDEMIHIPTLYDVAHEAGLTTGDSGWPANQRAGTIDYTFPGAVDNIKLMTPELRQDVIDMGLIEEGMTSLWGQEDYGQVRRDHIWTETALQILRAYIPDLLLFHLLNADSAQHAFGRDTVPAHLAMAVSDQNVRNLINTLKEEGIRDETNIFIVSDHGFVNVDYSIQPNRRLRELGLLQVDDDGQIDYADVQVVPAGGTAMVYSTHPENAEENLDQAYEHLKELEGIDQVITPENYDEYGYPDPRENDQMGDFVLAAEAGYSFGGQADEGDYVVPVDGPAGTHGYLNELPEMYNVFIANGPDIEKGVELDKVDVRSVAPTAAEILGLELEQADGEVLYEILRD